MSEHLDGKAEQIRTREVIYCPECKYYYAPVCTFYKWLLMTSRQGYCYHGIRGQYQGPVPVVGLRGEHKMRMKKDVMWAEIGKLTDKIDGFQGDALAQLIATYKDCRNELCLKCGRYKESHNGACKGCRWEND